MAELSVDKVVKEYPTSAGTLRILDGVSFQLSAGQNLAILGPSGSGKSTLLHIVGSLDWPTSGNVTLGGVNLHTLPEHELARVRNRQIGFVFQEHHLLPQLSAWENVMLPGIAGRGGEGDLAGRARQLLERAGLESRLHHRPAALSGGERQRVAVARALLMRPACLLADEPTGNLDPDSAALVGDLLLDLQREENVLLILVTHSHSLAERCQRCGVLRRGRLEMREGA